MTIDSDADCESGQIKTKVVKTDKIATLKFGCVKEMECDEKVKCAILLFFKI